MMGIPTLKYKQFTRWFSLFIISLLPIFASAQTSGTNDFVYSLLNLYPEDYYKNNGLTIFPILSLPFGGEEQALGNAYTAVSREVSFLNSNPAASPLQDKTEFAIHHANIISDVMLETMAFSDRWDNIGIGAFVQILHSEFTALGISGEQKASSAYTETLIGANFGYNFLKSYYFSGISIGANLKFVYRSIPKELYAHVTGLNGTDQSAVGLMGDIGLLSRFNFLKGYYARDKNFSVGLTLRNLGPLVQNEPLPTTITLGLAYQPLRFWLVSFDFTQPINLQDINQSEHFGYAVGTALQFVDFFSVKGGFQIKGGNPRISLGGSIDLKDISFEVNYVLDLSTQFKIPDHLSIQGKLNLGDNGRALLQKKVDSLYIDALLALSQTDYEKVIGLCDQALAIDPTFSPANETRALAEKSKKLSDQIDSIRIDTQTIDPKQ